MSVPGVLHSMVCIGGFLDPVRSPSDPQYRFGPADALWTLAMACNVYLTFFRQYDAAKLQTLEPYYWVICYGLSFIPAFTYLFVRTASRGKVYGDAGVCQEVPHMYKPTAYPIP